ncbi:putative Co/Zn/Cd efflux system membrane fusion protein [Enhygromyxa salina]|uniref:Putative Co/Zn/Cd efflux system membrane fusion protein n=1 Tax=Enhygromyxa salina TaxID=215803 RepID=A0A0C1ZA27_9BACT|nr:efflux RND transporter periplasmic adaptor subunit [Enhygromyxa salina]KIG14464.1 putative Co/Zn/Cd efflux system membrane fusion protein [Enhygromyxa salina]
MSKIPSEAPSSWLPWLLVPIVALLAFGLGRCVPELVTPAKPNDHAHEDSAEVWTCSMHPQVRQPTPGDCPICGMDLIPLTDVGGGSEQVVLSKRAAVLARIETVAVQRIATPGVDLRLLGRVEVDESRMRNVSAWIGGRVDKLFVRETGTVVRRGQPIASLYSPEVYAAHQDLLTANKSVTKLRNASELARSSAEATLAAARQRLSLLGLADAEIDRMAEAGAPRKSVTINATDGGTVTERLATQGQYVEAGTVLFRIADLSRLWVQLDAYESDLPALMEGQSVDIEVEALAGERFTGEVAFIAPLVDARRRVTRVRVEVDNPTGKLRPGMFVEAVVRGGAVGEAKQKPLVVPVTAPLFTGRRSLVYVELPPTEQGGRPSYVPRVVELGPRMGDLYPVVAGLSAGERVVVHGAFAIDADLQIRGGASMMTQADANAEREPLARIEPNQKLRSELAAVLGAYLDMQVALADDDWHAAQAAAGRMLEATRAVAPARDSAADQAWSVIGAALESHAKQAAESQAIEGARGAFLHASGLAQQILAVFGNPLDTPLRLAFCPMAGANEGAEWIQATDVLANSYFGESMLSCGEFRSTIEPGQYLLSTAGAPVSAGGGGR